MISALITLLLVPFFPSLESPDVVHAGEMGKLVQRLEQTGKPVVIDPSVLVFSPEPKAPLPPISGRLLAQRVGPKAQELASTAKAGAMWALTGIIYVGGKRVAILNDGAQDHVVAQGSFVNKQVKVTDLTSNSAVLIPLGEAEAKPIRLNLTETPKNGASND